MTSVPRLAPALILLATAFAHAQATLPAAVSDDPLHAWVVSSDPASFEAWIDQRLAAEKADIDKLLAVNGPRTVENTLRPYDDAVNELTLAGNNAFLLYSLADAAPLRDRAQALTAKVSSASSQLSLNQDVYKALAAVPLPDRDPATRQYLTRSLLQYRIAGVDKDEATRKQVSDLNDRITNLTLAFGRNVADGTLKVKATRAELEGLPDDYIARHKPDADGTYTLTTDEPDVRPVLGYSMSPELRRRMFLAYQTRAYPKNTQVLRDLLEARQQLATTLGYAHYADLATADSMIGSPANIEKLIHAVDDASRSAAEKEFAQLLAFAQKREPSLDGISQADGSYWKRQYAQATYNFDAQAVRPYFPYPQVQAGILAIAAQFFHVTFKPISDAAVWDKSVDVFDVYDAVSGASSRRLGRIYLDMHPREGKDKWFSAGPVVPGIRGRQVPEGMLICNFTGGTAGDPGLMEYSEVNTFFHEFGHLMHYILGSQGEWAWEGSFNAENDFLEAPSQMLEEILRSPAVLQSFARHYKTGEVLPINLIRNMNAADAYGRADSMQWDLWFSTYALQLHNQSPAGLDFDALWRDDMLRYSRYAPVDGVHYYAAFVHLEGYASNLYTYLLDKVIALDLYSQFDTSHLLDGPAAMRYRHMVLEPGASAPAAQLVTDFLGRPYRLDAMKKWMNEEFEIPAANPAP